MKGTHELGHAFSVGKYQMFDGILFWLMKDLKKPHVYPLTSDGADPTGNSDSTEALLAAIADAAKGQLKGS